MNRVDDLVEVASRQVGAADASGEERVAGNDHLERCEMEADGALSVARCVEYAGGVIVESDRLAVGQGFVGRCGIGRLNAKPGGLGSHYVEEGQIVFVQEDRSSGQRLELERAAYVIDVRVSDKDLLKLEAKHGQTAVNARDLVAGIDHDGFAGFLVAHEGAIALQRADREGFEDHGAIVFR